MTPSMITTQSINDQTANTCFYQLHNSNNLHFPQNHFSSTPLKRTLHSFYYQPGGVEIRKNIYIDHNRRVTNCAKPFPFFFFFTQCNNGYSSSDCMVCSIFTTSTPIPLFSTPINTKNNLLFIFSFSASRLSNRRWTVRNTNWYET